MESVWYHSLCSDRSEKASILEAFRARKRPEKLTAVVSAFENGVVVHAGEDIASSEYAKLLTDVPALEGLHLSKRLNKDALGGRAAYRGRG